jgi:hypothetical protein
MAIIANEMQQGQPPMPPGQPPMPPGQPPAQPPGQPPEQDDSQVSPEEQQEYEKAMVVVGRMLFDSGAIKNIAQQVASSKDVASALAQQALTVVRAVDEKSGGTIPEGVLAPIAMDVLGDIAEAAEAAGAEVNGQVLTDALTKMITTYLRDEGAKDEEIQQMLAQIDIQGMAQKIDADLQGGGEEAGEPAEEAPGQPEEDAPGVVESGMEDEEQP